MELAAIARNGHVKACECFVQLLFREGVMIAVSSWNVAYNRELAHYHERFSNAAIGFSF